MKLNIRRAAMENNFLEAFDNANKLQEGPINAFKTAVANHQVNKQNKANAEKQNAANVNADVANENGYQQIIADLQKIANEQVQFDKNSIDDFIEKINNLKSLDDKSKKQINQMLNQQKAMLQQKEQPADNQQNNAEKPAENGSTNVNDAAGTTTEQPAQPEQKGDASKITKDGDKNVVNTYIDSAVQKLQSSINGISRDDVIAYIKTL